MDNRSHKPSYWLLVVLLLVMSGFLTVRINAGWYGHHDENGRWISTAVRNYALYGAEELGYLVTTTPNPSDADTIVYYVNHPPLIVWTAWLASELFGRYETGMSYPDAWPKEMSVRLVSIFATMVSLSAFYVLVRRLLGQRLALLSLALYSFTPMIIYFGRMPNHEPLALPFIYLFTAILINWLRRFSWQRTLALIVCAIIAMWTAWASAFFFATLGVVVLIFGGNRHRSVMIGIGLITLIATIAIPLFYEKQHPGSLNTLLEAFSFRTSNRTLGRDSTSFSVGQFITQLLIHMLSAMTVAVVLFGLWGVGLAVRTKTGLTRAIIIALLLAPMGYMLLFRNAFHVHDYYKIVYLPAFAICATLTIQQLWLSPQRGIGRYGRPFVVAVMICSTILGAIWLVILHQVGGKPDLSEIVTILPTYTQEEDVILTNLAGMHPVIDYYTYRTIEYDTAPETAVTQIQAGEAKYLYCVLEPENQNTLAELQAEFTSESITDECFLFEGD